MNDKKFDPKEVEEILGGKMSKDFTEANYVLSFINGQPGLVVRDDNPAELEAKMNAILPYFKKFRAAVEKAGVKKAEEGGLTAKCETCGAVMVKRSGTSKAGKPWNALFCPNADVNDKSKHKPVWL